MMRPPLRLVPALFGACLALSVGAHPSPAAAAPTAPKYWIVVRDILDEAGVKPGMNEEARRLLDAELRAHPEITVDPAGLSPTTPEAELEAALKQRKLRAFQVTLKLQSVSESLDPPPPGKQYNVLKRGIKLSLFGDTIPGHVIAVGGDGSASAGVEVNKTADAATLEREGKAVMTDVLKDALKQAVEMTLKKLQLAEASAAAAGKGGAKKKPKAAH